MWIDDQILSKSQEQQTIRVFRPDTILVVAGSGNVIDTEINRDNCQSDHIAIVRRRGGGGAVVLYPGSLVISIGAWVRHQYQNKKYFDLINQAIITALETHGYNGPELGLAGLSDISQDSLKIAGTSMFRSGNYLLYQGSLLLEDQKNYFSRYLHHPSREPDYRNGKSHKEFAGSLAALDPVFVEKFSTVEFSRSLETQLVIALENELIAPEPQQIKRVKARIKQES